MNLTTAGVLVQTRVDRKLGRWIKRAAKDKRMTDA